MARPLRTLIVDPSPAFREVVVRWAAERPELVVAGTVSDGAEATAAAELLRPDLVLVEAVLPPADGFELTRRLKALPHAPRVVVVTFVASSAMRDRALAAGADGFVPKDDFASVFGLLLGELVDSVARARHIPEHPGRSARRGPPSVEET